MRVMITSFGVQHSLSNEPNPRTMFHRMPPVSFRSINQAFMPDYELLLLCDSIIMDETSFDWLVRRSVAAYSEVAETFHALRAEGRIELRDFSSILDTHSPLFERMLRSDLELLEQWVEPLRESLDLWRHFTQMSMGLVHDEQGAWFDTRHGIPARDLHDPRGYAVLHEVAHLMHHDRYAAAKVSSLVNEALTSKDKRRRKQHREALRDTVGAYLAYVDANLILANKLQVGFHDWLDFTPFYAAKFLSVGREDDPVRESREKLEQLFTIPFPELAIRSPSALLKALNDKRVEDLRLLVKAAVDDGSEFDISFARTVLSEVFRNSERAKKMRTITGYATLPIGLIPWVGTPAQKVIEEAIAIPLETKLKEKHRWFYMLSDIAEAADEGA